MLTCGASQLLNNMQGGLAIIESANKYILYITDAYNSCQVNLRLIGTYFSIIF